MFLISQPKHILWVLKRTVSMRFQSHLERGRGLGILSTRPLTILIMILSVSTGQNSYHLVCGLGELR